MKVNLRTGVDKLLFGMKQQDVKAIYGEPDREYKDDEENIIYVYNKEKFRLTFYSDEDLRLGYIISANPDLELFSNKIIGQKWGDVTAVLKENKITSFEKEPFDITDNYFNEDNWVIFQVEFDEVDTLELGAVFNSKDEFDWKF
ncbi:hypothetical protein Q763_05050 [Flavobacterium beibuense F44-8]|uniref:Uncharacterized protein n=1 Tax=Flavobacterium beibuense F44-8 TaxID=1406840 RepID=A0A0A2LR66_9FLAO|nr:hypothetical protein [Flavobacterium beibuense]KGO82469.1 hypothetical protein Q763_05050 [Flavobacterium beibuense F44-8]